jgi:hypothetical protein
MDFGGYSLLPETSLPSSPMPPEDSDYLSLQALASENGVGLWASRSLEAEESEIQDRQLVCYGMVRQFYEYDDDALSICRYIERPYSSLATCYR